MPPEAAVVLDLHARDGSTQEISTTIPLEVLSDDTVDERGSRLDRWLADTAVMNSRSVWSSSSSSSGGDVGQ